MDFLRSCYSSSMRLYPDRPDVLTAGAWHFCAPGARVIPYMDAFVSQNWDYAIVPDPVVGEVRGRRTWVSGKPVPGYQGMHFCGTGDAWLHGIPFADRPGLPIDAHGVPVCCKPLPYIANGGNVCFSICVNGPTTVIP